MQLLSTDRNALCALGLLCAIGWPRASWERRIAQARLEETFSQPDTLLGLTLEQLETRVGPCTQWGAWDHGGAAATWQGSQVEYDVWFREGRCFEITHRLKR